jgi:hypothetical protein
MGISDDDADRAMINCRLYDRAAAALASAFKASSCAVPWFGSTGSMAVPVDPMIGGRAAGGGL